MHQKYEYSEMLFRIWLSENRHNFSGYTIIPYIVYNLVDDTLVPIVSYTQAFRVRNI